MQVLQTVLEVTLAGDTTYSAAVHVRQGRQAVWPAVSWYKPAAQLAHAGLTAADDEPEQLPFRYSPMLQALAAVHSAHARSLVAVGDWVSYCKALQMRVILHDVCPGLS